MKNVKKLKIEKLGNNGEGIAYFKKMPVFVDKALPKEVVLADVFINPRGQYEGNLVKIIKKSKLRVDPPCPIYKKCDGCNLQHISYFDQIRHKRNVLNFLFNVKLRKETKKTKLNLTIKSEREIGYRNRVILPVRNYRDKLEVGLYKKDSNHFIKLNGCLVHKLNINLLLDNILKILEEENILAFNDRTKKGLVRYLIIRSNKKGDLQVTIVSYKDYDYSKIAKMIVNKSPKVKSVFYTVNNNLKARDFFGSKLVLLEGDYYLEETLRDKTLMLGPESFFQLNLEQAINMYNEVIRMADFKKEDIVLDAYAGVATIGIYISDYVGKVHSIELNGDAVKAANEAITKGNISNVKVHKGDTLEVASKLKGKFDVMIFDPPRNGLGDSLVKYILKEEPKKVIYCSCNPKTLVYDLKKFSKKYKIVETTPIDMFPQTGHIESVTLLVRK